MALIRPSFFSGRNTSKILRVDPTGLTLPTMTEELFYGIDTSGNIVLASPDTAPDILGCYVGADAGGFLMFEQERVVFSSAVLVDGPGTRYYLADGGTLLTTPSAVEVGIAISTTTLIITGTKSAAASGASPVTFLKNSFYTDQFISNSFGSVSYPVGSFDITEVTFPQNSMLEVVLTGRYGNLTGGNVVFNPRLLVGPSLSVQLGQVQVLAGAAPDFYHVFRIFSNGPDYLYYQAYSMLRTYATAPVNQTQVLNGTGAAMGSRPSGSFTWTITPAEFFNTTNPNVSAVLNHVVATVWSGVGDTDEAGPS